MTTSKSVKLFNLEERKSQNGSITEVDIYQWKNTLLDNLSKDSEFRDHCKDSSRWDVEKVPNRGFIDTVQGDGTAEKKAGQVQSMLTKIASYAPKTIVREITRRTKSLADIWNIAREWAGVQSSGAKHLDYYKTKMSFQKVDKEETKQEFFYRLRDAMEDTLIMQRDNITDDGERVSVDEDMTPTVKSIVVLDWLDAIGGPALVEHVHRVYAKELESVTLSTLQSRIWKNMDVLLREAEGSEEDPGKVFQVDALSGINLRQVNKPSPGNRGNRRFRGQSSRFEKDSKQSYGRGRDQGQGRRGTNVGGRGAFQRSGSRAFCKLCKANNSPNYLSHDISDCWLLDENDRNKITQNFAKAQALFANYPEEVFDNEEEELNSEELEDEDEY